MIVTKILAGHTSPETAYQVDDYPYGFRLRCKIRYWIEYRKGFGFRFMSQTTNPKRPTEVWNKPKGSGYNVLTIMVLDEVGHVANIGLRDHGWEDIETVNTFAGKYAEALTSPEYQGALDHLRKVAPLK